jgi:hypothetical protein
MIFGTDEVAKYICRRIYGFYVNPMIDAATEDLIDDPFFKGDEEKETADEKRLRITKNLINELKNDQKQQDN